MRMKDIKLIIDNELDRNKDIGFCQHDDLFKITMF